MHCQLGEGAVGQTSSHQLVPFARKGEAEGLISYEVGAWFVCGLHTEGDVYCWGSDWENAIPPVYRPECNPAPWRIRSF